jgi:hypothetical protein
MRFLNSASFLDPRFNQTFDSDGLSQIKSTIKEEVQRKFNESHKPGTKSDADKTAENNNKLKSRFS